MTSPTPTPPVFGIVGWKNSGKTTLVSNLIAELTRRGIKVAAVKHAHHAFDVDQPGRDSFKFREAGAREVAVISDKRVAIMHELREEAEPALEEVLKRLEGSELILVEGFKRHDHPKIEARRREAVQQDPMGAEFPGIVAIASDHEVETGDVLVFALDDVSGMAEFILRHTGLKETT
jgi:molybdopterin-guanine dinucleotide biosynthesis protein B